MTRVINIPMTVIIGRIVPVPGDLNPLQLNQLAFAAAHIIETNDAQSVAFYPHFPGGKGEVVAFKRSNGRVSLLGKEYHYWG